MKLFNAIISLTIILILSACSSQPRAIDVVENSNNVSTNRNSETPNESVSSFDTASTNNQPPSHIKTVTIDDYINSLNQIKIANNSENIWRILADNFTLQTDYYRYEVDLVMNRFERQQTYFNRLQENAEYYLAYIVNQTQRRNMPLEIALLPIIESTLSPFAISGSNAKGIWQFIRSTGKIYNLQSNSWEDPRRDIVKSTNAGLEYLQKMYREFGDWHLAMAAYNGGPGTIRRAQNKNRTLGLATDYWSLSLTKETREYVPKILALARVISDPDQYGISLKPLNNSLFSRHAVTGAFKLSQVAACAELDFEKFYRYNPQYRKANTQFKDHIFLLPQPNTSIFNHNVVNGITSCPEGSSDFAQRTMDQLAGIKNNHVAPFIEKQASSKTYQTSKLSNKKVIHILKPGETIWRVSQNYNVSLNSLIKWNNITDTRNIPAGEILIIWK